MDDLNQKRLEKGEPLSVYGKGEDEINEMMTEACKMVGYNGRTYTGPRSNPVGDYQLSIWQPFGSFPTYEAPTEVAKLLGYTLISTQRYEGWFHLYFDADEDRGGCLRRIDILDGVVGGICRSDVLGGGLVDPISEFTKVKGQVLRRVEAFRSGTLVLKLESGQVDVEWDCPLDAERDSKNRVVREEGKANFERMLVARLE